MKSKKIIFILLSVLLLIFILVPSTFAASYPKLISTLNSAFEKIESWIIKISTPAAAISIGSGVLMKKFSFGDDEKIRTGKKLIRTALISYVFIILLRLILT